MEKRVSTKVDHYFSTFKENVRERALQMGISRNEQLSQLLQYIFDYDRLSFQKDDFQKRKRVKNFIPLFDRCCAKRADDEQCTRKKRGDSEFCGTHLKGTPHGVVEAPTDQKKAVHVVEVYAQDIQGIIYYIDRFSNVYSTEDVMCNRVNPRIIAKYVRQGDSFVIPEFLS